MKQKTPVHDQLQNVKAPPAAETSRLRNMRASKAVAALDKAAAGTHPMKGNVDRAGFDLGGVDGEPIDAGLRETEIPI